MDFDFKDLFIFDLANNHQGNLAHGLRVIREIAKVVKTKKIRAAFKLQLRQLDTFIHDAYKKNTEHKHISRFISTSLSRDDHRKLLNEVSAQGMLTMATPFDEDSVDMIRDFEVEIIKVASCSAIDRPLLKKISEVNLPVVISTAGLNLSQIDRLVSLFEHKRSHFALMHCSAIYPTPEESLRLNQIALLKARFPDITIGFSTHESPNNYSAIKIAYAKGARIFERHVGIVTERYKLNAYSSTPAQMSHWLSHYFKAVAMCGGEVRSPSSPEEMASLCSLMRGVFASREIKKGEIITRKDVFFAMPLLDGMLSTGEWYEGIIADKHYARHEALNATLATVSVSNEEVLYQIMLQVKGMLNNAGIFIGKESSVEISHHYGLDRFREFGCVIINCINRAYCKKLIVQLPRQKHPYHYHKKKEETFQLLHGDLEIELEGIKVKLKPGDTFLVKQQQWHKFHTLDGAIVEEVSTTHYNDDAFYEDARIARFSRDKRKTSIANWEAVLAKLT